MLRMPLLQSIVSDRDKVFMSHFWEDLFKLHGTKLLHITLKLTVSQRS